MTGKQIVQKTLLVVLGFLAILFSITSAISLFAFVFNPSEKGLLQFFIGSSIVCAILWGSIFYLAKSTTTQTKEEKIKELKEIAVKLPMILLSVLITAVYVFIYFMFFAFTTVSKNKGGGWGGDNSGVVLGLVFFTIAIVIIGLVMYNLFKTDVQDLKMTLYNQFMILKWSSIIALPFGFWSTYYYYHTEGFAGYVAMFIWMIILYGIYKLFAKISDKVHESISDATIARILHEKKKKIMNENKII